MPNGTALEVAPGDESFTVMVTVPGAAISALEMEAVRIALVPNVVGTALPFHRTTDELVNPLPFTNKLKLVPPATTNEGTRVLQHESGNHESDGDTSDPAPRNFR